MFGYRIILGHGIASNQSPLPVCRVGVRSTVVAADGPEATSRDATSNKPGLIRQGPNLIIHLISLYLVSSSC